MSERSGPKPPVNLSIKLPDDVAEILHRVAYETGRSKRSLVVGAVRQAYAHYEENQREWPAEQAEQAEQAE
jgi:predicted transcriptional regulator